MVVKYHVVVYGFVQIQDAVQRVLGSQGQVLFGLLIRGFEPDLRFIKWLEGGIGIPVNGGVKDVSAVQFTIRGYVGTAAGETQS
jgi:hypothetical protein